VLIKQLLGLAFVAIEIVGPHHEVGQHARRDLLPDRESE
jgi:hypothetical protein